MHRAVNALAYLLGHIAFINCSPAPALQTTGTFLDPSPTSCDNDPTDCNRPADASIYICEHLNWQPPCYLFHLDVANNAQYGWGESPSQWADGSWTVGSWGPAPGIYTTLFSKYQVNRSSPTDPEYTYPGTPDVGPFWRENIFSFIAGWDPNQDPLTLPQTASATAPGPMPVRVGTKKTRDKIADSQRPAWIHKAYF